MYACVIFDMDGTLTHTNELIFASFNYVLKKHRGTTYTPSQIIGLFGPPEEGAVAKVFGQDMVDPIMQELLAYYTEHHQTLAHLHSGMDGVLRFLKERGILVALFTGKGHRTTAITLDALHIAPFFDFIVTGNDVERHKPDSEGIEKILAHFQIEPSRALMVGDSMADVLAARGAGVPVAAVLWDSYDHERVTHAVPDYLFHSVAELEQWLRKHINGKAAVGLPTAGDHRKE